MHSRAAQLSLFAVTALIGVLLVGQLRSQARPVELSSLSADDLSALVDQLLTRNGELQDGLRLLRDQVRDYELAESLGQSGQDQTEQELLRIRVFGGLGAVEGQGVHISVDGFLDYIAVNDLINELRNAGAEAIAIDAVRITAASVAGQGADAIEIDGIEIGSPFTIDAIGSPDGLLSTLDRPGGIKAQLEQSVAATIVIEQRQQIEIPATERNLVPQVAQPVE
jgi:uncharacterized protein YlxW (UPF0749 family)